MTDVRAAVQKRCALNSLQQKTDWSFCFPQLSRLVSERQTDTKLHQSFAFRAEEAHTQQTCLIVSSSRDARRFFCQSGTDATRSIFFNGWTGLESKTKSAVFINLFSKLSSSEMKQADISKTVGQVQVICVIACASILACGGDWSSANRNKQREDLSPNNKTPRG